MKKLLCFFVFAVCLALFGVAAFAAAGDIDADDSVTATDARLALRMSVDLEPALSSDPEKTAAADADLDGSVTAMDARLILRASVELVDLSEILPESARLTEEELAAQIRKAEAPRIMITYANGETSSVQKALLLDAEGTALIKYSSIRTAIDIRLMYPKTDDEKGEVQVLAVDKARGFAVIRLPGSYDPPAINRSSYNINDPVYFIDTKGDVHEESLMILEPKPDPSEPQVVRLAVKAEYSTHALYGARSDRFGRPIGLFLREGFDSRSLEYLPLSVAYTVDWSKPVSLEYLAREELKVTINLESDSCLLLKNGTGLLAFSVERPYVERPYLEKPVVQYAGKALTCDLIQTNSAGSGGTERYLLVLRAKDICKNEPVTISVKGAMETFKKTVSVTVEEEGYVNMVGLELIPDPGVIWGAPPASVTVYPGLFEAYFTYQKKDLGLTNEEIVYSLAEYLLAMEYKNETDLEGSYRFSKTADVYLFLLPQTDPYSWVCLEIERDTVRVIFTDQYPGE